MARDLIIRNLPPETVRRLDILAAVAGLSREEFLRRLLEEAGARLAMEEVQKAVKP